MSFICFLCALLLLMLFHNCNRQKSSKSTPSEEPKVTTDTPSPFRDEFFVSCEVLYLKFDI